MKLTILFFTISFFSSYAIDAYSQTARLTLNMENSTLKDILKEIESQSEFRFFYSGNVNVESKATVSFENKNVIETLDELFKGTEIRYEIYGRQIALLNREETTLPAAIQQPARITGKVTDKANIPIPGVSVVIKGTTSGTVTDNGGNYTLTNVSDNATLFFSFVGMKSQEIQVRGQKVINITLIEETIGIDEVVAVGYGTMKKANITGAVSSVMSETLKERPVSNFGAAMVGQVAGVQIQQVSGAPGDEGLSVRIRGAGSITQSNDPLYVVDGYPMEGNVFRLLNPSDIESIEVLKDASSTAIYGSRGANGVIIVNTKKGRGPARISFNVYSGVQQLAKKIEMMNRDQYVQYLIDARNQAWLDMSIINADPDKTPHSITDPNTRRKLYSSANNLYVIPDGTGTFKYNFLDPASVATMPDNDWQDLVYRNAQIQQYEMSVSGANENTNYIFSGSYLQQDGIVLNSDYSRFNFRSSISSKINKHIEVGINMNSYFSQGNVVPEGRYSPMSYALNLPPIFPVNNPDGTYGSMVRNPEILAGEHVNPIAQAVQPYNYGKKNGWFGTLFANWDIIENLQYRVSVNGGIQSSISKSYLPSYVDQVGALAPRVATAGNTNAVDQDWVIEQTLTYSKTFAAKHSLTALAGYTTQKHAFENISGGARGFPNDEIYTLNAGTMNSLSSTETEYSMISYLARLNYSYDNRYLLTATVRRDGSSRFGKDNKWGTFPSVSLGWRVKQESFMQDLQTISDLKIRASFGIAGNNRIGDYSSIGLLSNGLYPTGDVAQLTIQPRTLSNNLLGWEKTEQINLGIDIAVIDNRVRFTADAYNTKSLDLLLDAPVPSITGFSTVMQNTGTVRNRGMEFQLSTENFVKDFKWSSDFNISFNRNKVLEVTGDRVIYAGVSGSGNTFITKRGYPIASFFGYVYEGVFKNQDELDKYPHMSVDKVGDGRYRDVNKDEKLDDQDRTIIGDNHPDFIAGFTNNFSYKNFTLLVLFNGSYGADLYSFFKRMVGTFNGSRNGMIEQLNRWKSEQEPGDGIHFRPTSNPTGLQLTSSSAWVTDASYLRLENLTLGYDFPVEKLKKLRMKNLRLYVTGRNLLTITNYPGLDPATSSEGIGLAKGGDFSGYPVARSFIIGLNVGL